MLYPIEGQSDGYHNERIGMTNEYVFRYCQNQRQSWSWW